MRSRDGNSEYTSIIVAYHNIFSFFVLVIDAIETWESITITQVACLVDLTNTTHLRRQDNSMSSLYVRLTQSLT